MHELVREDCFELIGREPVLEITRNQDQRTNPSHSEGRTGKPWDHAELGQVETHASCRTSDGTALLCIMPEQLGKRAPKLAPRTIPVPSRIQDSGNQQNVEPPMNWSE